MRGKNLLNNQLKSLSFILFAYRKNKKVGTFVFLCHWGYQKDSNASEMCTVHRRYIHVRVPEKV